MKFWQSAACPFLRRVAPLAGAWIEMVVTDRELQERIVAPLAGAWIEMAATISVLRL